MAKLDTLRSVDDQPLYRIDYLRASALRVTGNDRVAAFPSHSDDALNDLYRLVAGLYREAMEFERTYWVKPRELAAGKALLAHPEKHDAFMATWRWCAWARELRQRALREHLDGLNRATECLATAADTIARSDPRLTLSEVHELVEYISDVKYDKNLGMGFFPTMAFGSALEYYSRRARLPDVAHKPLRTILRDQRSTNNPIFDASTRRIRAALDRMVDGKTPDREPQGTDVEASARRLSTLSPGQVFRNEEIADVVKQIERLAANGPLSESMKLAVRALADCVGAVGNMPEQRIAARLVSLLKPDLSVVDPGEAWSDAVLAFVTSLPKEKQERWLGLLQACRQTAGALPSKKWTADAAASLKRVTTKALAPRLVEWLHLVERGRTAPLRFRRDGSQEMDPVMSDINMDILKGLCWTSCMVPARTDVCRALGRAAISCYRKVPGIGPRAVKVGNAAVYALGQIPGMDALGQLAMLRVKVKFGGAQKSIEKALNAAAAREGLPREEIEELGVPTYGLTEVGARSEVIGDFDAQLLVTDIGGTELRFIPRTGTKAGKPMKSVPAAVKKDHAEDLKELKAAAKDISAMLPAQRDRIDAMFLDQKSWAFGVWRERYLDHPLIGVLARRLIWRVTDDKGTTSRSVAWLDGTGTLVTVDGAPASFDEASAIVTLWHPVDAPVDETLAWRRFFEDRRIRQPFKQAHREVYLLTDAERRTDTYSNRFAAHVIRQHQFHALCAVRGWKNRLRLLVDDEYPPASRTLRAYGIRAEFWVEGVGEDYGTDTNDSGAFLHLATDQVRFYDLNAAQNTAHAGGGQYAMNAGNVPINHPLALDRVPALVLSEVLRDVDLFVGVASVGNNPQWQDGGPNGAFRDYWQAFSFGDLTESGNGRHDLLSRLLPRLEIADKCELKAKYLHVKGSLRTYKIHLGSGNILMEPNDQYLCIVPGSFTDRTAAGHDVFLPFEGDRTLAIILSKALLLAADDQIIDTTITRQIKRQA